MLRKPLKLFFFTFDCAYVKVLCNSKHLRHTAYCVYCFIKEKKITVSTSLFFGFSHLLDLVEPQGCIFRPHTLSKY